HEYVTSIPNLAPSIPNHVTLPAIHQTNQQNHMTKPAVHVPNTHPTKNATTLSMAAFPLNYFIANVISASQASSPSTVATPLPFSTGPFTLMISTSNLSWSPGF